MNQSKNSKKDQPEEIQGVSETINYFENIVMTGEASKLSSRSNGKISYELALHSEEKQLHIHLSGQTDGGLFSKEWVSVASVFSLIEENKEREFKSAVFSPLFKSGSSNNVSFFAALCRSLNLIERADSSVFVHKVSADYEEKKAELLALGNKSPRKKKKSL